MKTSKVVKSLNLKVSRLKLKVSNIKLSKALSLFNDQIHKDIETLELHNNASFNSTNKIKLKLTMLVQILQKPIRLNDGTSSGLSTFETHVNNITIFDFSTTNGIVKKKLCCLSNQI